MLVMRVRVGCTGAAVDHGPRAGTEAGVAGGQPSGRGAQGFEGACPRCARMADCPGVCQRALRPRCLPRQARAMHVQWMQRGLYQSASKCVLLDGTDSVEKPYVKLRVIGSTLVLIYIF